MRKVPTDLTNLRLEQGRSRHFGKIVNLPYDIINNPFNYTEKLERAGVLHFTADVTDAPTNWACDAHHHE